MKKGLILILLNTIFLLNLSAFTFTKETPIKTTLNSTLKEIFKNSNKKALQSNDSTTTQTELNSLSIELKNYYTINKLYSEVELNELSNNEIVMMGFLNLSNDLAKEKSNEVNKAATPELDCLFGVIGTTIGISDLIGDIIAIANGTFGGSYLTILRKVGKRFFGWATLAYGIYQLGGCFDLW